MKLKNIAIFIFTLLGISLLTIVCMNITVMPANDMYGDIEKSRIPSVSQRIITGVVFLSVILCCSIFAFIKKLNYMNLAISVFYFIPWIGFLVMGIESFDTFGAKFIWNPYYELFDYLKSFGWFLFILLPLIPLSFFIFRAVRHKQELSAN